MDPGGALVRTRGQIFGLAPAGGYEKDVPSRRTLITHQAADKGNLSPVRRPAGHRNLLPMQRSWGMFGVENGVRLAARERLAIQLGYPPVVFPGWGCGDVGEAPGVGSPVVLIDMQFGRAHLAKIPGCSFDRRPPLNFEALDADHPCRRLHGGEGPCGTAGSFNVEAGDV